MYIWKALKIIVMSIAAFPGLPFLTAWVGINPVFHRSQTEGKFTKDVLYLFCNIKMQCLVPCILHKYL